MKSLDTWERAKSDAEKLEILEKQLEIVQDQIAWTEDYMTRLRKKQGELQVEFDDLAEMKLKHR
jgi:hypothetical protein